LSGWRVDTVEKPVERVTLRARWKVLPNERQTPAVERLRAYLEAGYSVRHVARQDSMPSLRTLRYWLSWQRNMDGIRDFYRDMIVFRICTGQQNKRIARITPRIGDPLNRFDPGSIASATNE